MSHTREPPALCWREESLKEFQAIYQKVYGVLLDGEELEHAARYLLNLYISVYGNPGKLVKKLTHYEQR